MCACVLACVLQVLYVCVLHACMYVRYVLQLCSVLWMCVLYRMYRKYRGLFCNTVHVLTANVVARRPKKSWAGRHRAMS